MIGLGFSLWSIKLSDSIKKETTTFSALWDQMIDRVS